MLVRDLMTPSVPTVSGTDRIVDAAQTMIERNVGILVVTDGNDIIGMLSQGDIVRCVSTRVDLTGARVRDHMTEGAATVAPDDDARTAAHIMIERDLRHLPVVEKTIPIGLVSGVDVLRALTEGTSGGQEVITLNEDADAIRDIPIR